jgi:Ricin-type beta-trefoil lectin domain
MKKSGIACAIVLITALTSWTQVDAAQIVITNTLECIDIPHQQTADGTAVSLFGCHGSPNQQWTIANGQINGMSGVCLDVMGSAPRDGAAVIIVHCNGRDSEKWTLSNGQIVGIGGKCIDLVGASAQDHVALIIATCTSAHSQQWSIQ